MAPGQMLRCRLKDSNPAAMNSDQTPATVDCCELAPGLLVPRVIMGLWQVADMERGGQTLDPDLAANALERHARAGFFAFDMADHYGSAEVIVSRLLARTGLEPRARAFTKWCPEPGPMSAEVVREGVDRSARRMGVDRIDLLQLHWWQYTHPGYLDAALELAKLRQTGRIAHIGLTNFDTDHLGLLLGCGVPIATNQVSFSLLDRRASGRMSQRCSASGVRLLAYGTLGGGFLSDAWVGAPEPTHIADWSKSKYRRFIDAIGGWDALQTILSAARTIGQRHGVSVANVAVRWVLEQPAVGAVIVGMRPGEREHTASNKELFTFALDERDHDLLNRAFEKTRPLPGDCGDEYRRPPFLTASGDLSHHLQSLPAAFPVRPVPAVPGRLRVDTGSPWEPIAGYSRAIRDGNRILVSGTTATHPGLGVVCPGDVASQTVYALDRILASIEALGGRREDIVRTRVYLRDASRWQPAAEVHGRLLGDVLPANTMLGNATLIGDYDVEIEAEAVISRPPS